MAQVKLSFKGTNGSRMVVTRNLQLTVKKATRSVRNLEGSLLMVKDGERTVISSKVGDLDRIVPQYMGVSEAILDSVIFCHQDESLWPMSEPSALKKKFDEIFEAQKYTKAIDNLKSLRKSQGEKLRELKIREEHEKSNKAKGERVMQHCTKLEAEIEELRENEKELSQAMATAMKDAEEKRSRSVKANGIQEELKTKKLRLKYVLDNISDLSNIEQLAESDQWLEDTLAKYEERMAQMHDEQDSLRSRYDEIQEQIEASRKKLSAKHTEQGQQQAAKENHETNIAQRVQLVKQAAHKHSIRGYDGDISESQVVDFVDRVGKASREKDRELERIQKINEDEQRQTQAAVSEVDVRRSARSHDKVLARQAITANDKTIATLERQMSDIKVDEGGRTLLESSHRDVEARFQQSTADFEAADWDKHLRTENKRLAELENDSQRLRDDLVQISRVAGARAALDQKKKDLKARSQGLETLMLTYGGQIESILGTTWQLESLEREFQLVHDERARVLEEAKKDQESVTRELSNIDFKLSSLGDTLKKKKSEANALETAVLSSIENEEGEPIISTDDYLDELSKLQDTYDESQRSFEGNQYVSDFYKTCIDTANRQDKCKLCERKFNDGKERNSFMDKLQKKIAARQQELVTEELEELKATLKRATDARPAYESFQKVSKTEIPALEQEYRKLEGQREVVLTRLEGRDTIVKQKDAGKKDADQLKKHVESIARHYHEISGYEEEISRLSTQQKMSGNSLTAEEIEEQGTQCEDQIRALRTKINKMKDEKDRAKTRTKDLELELSHAKTKLDQAGVQMDKKRELMSRIEECRQSNEQHRNAMQRADSELEACILQLERAKALHDDTKQRGRAKENEVRTEQKKLSETVHAFKVNEQSIRSYIDDGGPEKLAACQKSITAFEKEQKSLNNEIASLTSTLNEMTKKISDSETLKRSISDNLKLRSNHRDRTSLEQDVTELMQSFSTEDAHRLANEVIDADKHYHHLSAERGPIVGAMKSKDEDLVRYLQEWETDYKDAAQNYREAHIKVETTKAAVEDLGQYGSALDAAVMKFHSLKMEEINRIAGELWQSTYQGTDIDTILIRSENENATAASTNRRNYNYRVCMVKQDAEMDMRGRCSAGQRVLASIIIRLALAECFGVNCGIIALDEPTTNLDQDNIKSLAESLHNIIKVRRQQQNFQLIVITHDEEFLKYMKCPEFTDNYWRVSRDGQQKSIIEKQSVAEIMG
ncbi:hypothetical protein BP5796_03351 [Coleophoma crateriformis]|uniref:Rad50/SbcC-type AAA domain-containing protein n=1 Tax=Coleophoma crateriformis TaxID=565419 RepID=A0A3D8SMW6_9HELO|nr:hypothetical protein BP5796_03351 [Coleophoma crateriformis]